MQRGTKTDADRTTEQGAVVVRHYALGAPLDWDGDIEDELRRENRLWNTLVEIDRYARDRYRAALNSTVAMGGLGAEIEKLAILREDLFTKRRARFSAARAKAGVDTADLDEQIGAVRQQLRERYALRKKRTSAAKREAADAITAIAAERKEFVKLARQRSGLFWCNYNDIVDAYSRARIAAMRQGATLRFHRYENGGRLVNQIQGGLSVEGLFGKRHSQVSVLRTPGGPGWTLAITAYTGRDENGKRYRRNVTFPLFLHRELPPSAIIKSVAVSVRAENPRTRTMSDHALREIGRDPVALREYAVTFTCRVPEPNERPSGTAACGINLGWKQVPGGLRAATAAFTDGSVEHLILPDALVRKMRRADDLQSLCDQEVNAMLPRIREALHGLPAPDDGVLVESVPEYWHRRLYRLLHASKMSVEQLLSLLFDLRILWEREPTAIPMLHALTADLESWRRRVKKNCYLPRRYLDRRGRRHRTHLYRTWASRIVDRAGLIALDATSYADSARLRDPETDEPTDLHEQARSNRFLAAPFDLRLAIEQCAAKRGVRLARYAGLINRCRSCGSDDLDGGPPQGGGAWRTCRACGNGLDIDETAARNLLDWVLGDSDTGPNNTSRAA